MEITPDSDLAERHCIHNDHSCLDESWTVIVLMRDHAGRRGLAFRLRYRRIGSYRSRIYSAFGGWSVIR